MRRFCIYIVLVFNLLSLSSLGQSTLQWISIDSIEKNGFYRNHGVNKEKRTVGVIFHNPTQTEKEFYIRLNNPHLNEIDVIGPKGDTLYHTGDRHPFDSRPVRFWDFVFPIRIAAGQTDSIQFSIEHFGERLNYFFESYSKDEFLQRRDLNVFLTGSFIAVYLMLSLGFFFLGIYRREAKNIYFSLFIIITGNWIINDQGVFFEYLWPNDTNLQDKFGTYFNTSSTGLLFFLIYFLEVFKEKVGSVAKNTIYVLSVFVIGRSILVLVIPDLIEEVSLKSTLLQISSLLMLICSLILMSSLYKFIIKKEYIIEALGFALFFGFTIRIILRQQGIDFFSVPKLDNFLFAVVQVLTVLIFTISNILAYRRSKRLQYEKNLVEAEQREREISKRIIDAQEYERTNIGKNLHDQLGGLLATMKIRLQMLKNKKMSPEGKEVDDVLRIVDRSSEEMYNIVDDLVLPEMNGKGLQEILKNRIEIISTNTGIVIDLRILEKNIPDDVSIKIYRIICELLNNSIKHSGCDRISINISSKEKEMLIHYSDNGVGFNKSSIRERHGLKNIESRVEFLKGSIDLDTRPGNTSYRITIPI